MTNLHKWDGWYAGLAEPQPYGGPTTYELAAEWLAPCSTVADWGCGKGGFSPYVQPPRRYVGFDGSVTPFASRVVDLASFQWPSEGLLLRHVIEHDYRWADILRNAERSYRRRMVVVLFTLLIDSPEPRVEQVAFQSLGPLGGVPDLSFSLAAIDEVIPTGRASALTVLSATQYGAETVLCYERSAE